MEATIDFDQISFALITKNFKEAVKLIEKLNAFDKTYEIEILLNKDKWFLPLILDNCTLMNFLDKMKFIDQKIKNEFLEYLKIEDPNYNQHSLFMNGAALPWFTKKTEGMKNLYVKLNETQTMKRGQIFSFLNSIITANAQILFGDKFIPYATAGTLNSFKATTNRLINKIKPTAILILSMTEYLPMVQYLMDIKTDKCTVYFLSSFSKEKDEDILERAKLVLEQFDKNETFILFGASVNRLGKIYEIDNIAEELRKTYKNIHLWVDASQDSISFPNADIIWYSKKFCSSGGGLVLINKLTNGEDHRFFKIESGFSVSVLSHLAAQLFLCNNKEYLNFSCHELISCPIRWLYPENRDTVEFNKKFLENCNKKFYGVVNFNYDEKSFLRNHLCINVRIAQECKKLNISDLFKELENLGLVASCFTIKKDLENYLEKYEIRLHDLKEINENVKKLIRNFEFDNNASLVRYLILPDEDIKVNIKHFPDSKENLEYLLYSIEDHEFIRLSMGVQSYDKIIKFEIFCLMLENALKNLNINC